MDTPFAEKKRRSIAAGYNPQALIERINDLLQKNKESGREAALTAGLDHQAMHRYLSGHRPNMVACILLANHFRINPNELLQLAGWPKLNAFDIYIEGAENLPLEAVEVAKGIARIPDPVKRKQVAEAMLVLVEKCIE